MKTLDRYLAATFLKNFLLSTVALTALYLFQSLLGELIDHEFATRQILFYNFLALPQILVQMIPPAVLIGTVMTISGLNRTNELVACFSLGFGLNRVVLLLLSLVFMISCFTVFLQDRVLPPTFKKRTTYYERDMRKRQDFFLDVKQDKIWYRSRNLIYNLRSFDAKTRTIRGMAVYTFDDGFNLKQVVDAESALYTPQGWKLRDGTVTTFAADDDFPQTQTFREKELQIAETPTDFQEIDKQVDGLRLKELYRYIQRTRAAGADTKSFEVKFHSRLSLSFIPLVMCVLGVPFSSRNRREGGLARDLGMCLGITFFYWLFYSVGLSLGTNGALPPWVAAWLPSAIFAALAAFWLARSTR
jgi:lipopolysaccharide export system permease protein